MYNVLVFLTYAAAERWPRYLESIFALSFTAVALWPGDVSEVTTPRRAQLKSAEKLSHHSMSACDWASKSTPRLQRITDRHDSISASKRTQGANMLSVEYTPSQLTLQPFPANTLSFIACQASHGKAVTR